MPHGWLDDRAWADPRVVEWFRENRSVCLLDVATDRALVGEIAAFDPGELVAIRDAAEFDRLPSGLHTAEELLAWFRGLEAGERYVVEQGHWVNDTPEAAERRDQVIKQARELVVAGAEREAMWHYLLVWCQLRRTASMQSLAGATLIEEMRLLARASYDVRGTLLGYRKVLDDHLKQERVRTDDLDDWLTLNAVLDDDATVVAWIDWVKSVPRMRPLLAACGWDLRRILLRNSRWDLIPFTRVDPLEPLQTLLWTDQVMRGQSWDIDVARQMRDETFEWFGLAYAGMLAGGDEASAEEFAEAGRVHYGRQGLTAALVRTALQAGQPREIQLRWLKADEWTENGWRLQADVERALEATRSGPPPAEGTKP